MDAKESKVAFLQAGQHFKDKEYDEALQILNRLNKTNPGDKDILYPMSQCMFKTNRFDEAKKICAYLVQKFDHNGAKQLLHQIQAPPDPMAGIGNLDSDMNIGLDAGMDLGLGSSGSSAFGAPTNQNAPPPLERATAFDEAKPVILWVGLLIAAYVQYYFVANGFDGEAYLEKIHASLKDETFEISSVFKPMIPLYASSFLHDFFVAVFATYFSLKTVSALLHDDFVDDMKDAALYTLYCFLLMFVPIIGWIAIPVIIKKHYELGFGKLLGVIVLWCIYGAVANFIFELPIDTPSYWTNQIDYTLAPQ